MSNFNTVLARNTENAPKGIGEGSQTVAFSHYNHFSAQLPIDPKTGLVVEGGVKAQAKQCFENLKNVVESIDHIMNDVVRITIFVKNIKDVDLIDEVYKSYFTTYVPSRTVVAVAAIPMDALVQVEAVLSHGEGTIPNAPQAGDLIKLTNNTEKAPISKLSTQTVAFSHYNNISAQLPVDAAGKMVAGGAKEQAFQCFTNIKEIIESIGHGMDDVVKVNVFLKDLTDFELVNSACDEFFKEVVPAKRVIGVSALPKDALVQIDVVAANAEGTPPIL